MQDQAVPISSPDRSRPHARRIPSVLIYVGFAALSTLATFPAWRVYAFGLNLDDLLRLRCF
ncbi:hypothetical protein D4Q52_10075 [Rhodopseudomonas palustris]|uniref:Uncharacterized protein n=1 Tax=Rhodopseudomonas palustris TaxID=1076 RepID=A0A418VHK4_RHOPL|nr:hypothetical protein D4Q52_10075 [Rhodopseudomonas palustris]